MKAEVVVVGGGLIGSSIAYYLSEQGVNVILLEKRGICLGTSGAGGELCSLHTKRPGIHLELARKSIQELEKLERKKDELPYSLEYRKCGSMILIETKIEEKIMDEFFARKKKCGVDIKYLAPEEVKELVPIVSDNIRGATYVPSNLSVNPISLNIGFLEMAKKNGAKLMFGTSATKILLDNNRNVKHVVTSDDIKIRTKFVVNAAGVEAPEIGEMVGIPVPIKPRRGEVLVTERAPLNTLKVHVSDAKSVAIKFGVTALSGVGLGAGQTASGTILIGTTRKFAGYDTSVSLEGMVSLARNAVHLLPGLRSFHIIRAFAGLRPYTADGLPIIGYVKNIGGFIMAAGHGGDGVTLSPITGELVSELITKGKTSFPLEKLSLERFN